MLGREKMGWWEGKGVVSLSRHSSLGQVRSGDQRGSFFFLLGILESSVGRARPKSRNKNRSKSALFQSLKHFGRWIELLDAFWAVRSRSGTIWAAGSKAGAVAMNINSFPALLLTP